MKIKQLISTYAQALTDRYAGTLLPSHRRALDAMLACRSQCGEFYCHCNLCGTDRVLPLSCGHRSCPQCQHQLGLAWQQRQQTKLLPVTYYMVTFTLPFELRQTAYQHQSIVYDLMIKAAAEALQTIGKNNHHLKLGLSAILHTHKRDKGYHPHVHLVLPGGGIKTHTKRVTWQALKEDFIVNELALARVFRGIFLRKLFEQAIDLPYGLPRQWVAHIRNVGRGDKALEYLSRYLYRGVISENDILTDNQGQVCFRYQESQSKKIVHKRMPAEAFIFALLRHVLPRGFRRVRDYGFLHANAGKTLKRIQLMLRVKVSTRKTITIPISCQSCLMPMEIVAVLPKRIPILFRFYRVGSGIPEIPH